MPAKGPLSPLACQGRQGRQGRQVRVFLSAVGDAAAVDTEDMLVALGRNLWAAADELLEVSAALSAAVPRSDNRKFSPLGLGAAALAMRTAADNILDDDWEDAMGELEVAVVYPSLSTKFSFKPALVSFSTTMPPPVDLPY